MICDLQGCYNQLGGDYAEVMTRLSREPLIRKFIFKFLDDQSYRELISAMESKDCAAAFRAAHTIKGICLNLSFSKLAASVVVLTEALRAEDMERAQAILSQVSADYRQTADAIRQFRAFIEGADDE